MGLNSPDGNIMGWYMMVMLRYRVGRYGMGKLRITKNIGVMQLLCAMVKSWIRYDY